MIWNTVTAMPVKSSLIHRPGWIRLPNVRPVVPVEFPQVAQTACYAINKSKKTSKQFKSWVKQHPYLYQLSQQRKAANKERQRELRDIRQNALGSPVFGVPTPWAESLDTAGQVDVSKPQINERGEQVGEPHQLPTAKHLLNFGIERNNLEDTLNYAYELTKPCFSEYSKEVLKKNSNVAKDLEQHDKDHERRSLAVNRILSMDNGSSKQRLSTNIRRIVEAFGRHNTDKFLPEIPNPLITEPYKPTPRGGPDTGSSEVQIAILTAKIRTLANEISAHGLGDKHNKRNLRLLMHRRQKLMRYMYRKERSGPRWNHLCATLGLTDACWRNEI